ncbi:MAG: omptin family outer membrane protease [Desulfomonilaceae bacterium]
MNLISCSFSSGRISDIFPLLRRCLPATLILLLILLSAQAIAQITPTEPDSFSHSFHDTYIALGLRKYFNSFTSFQFPDPVNTRLDPTSRLEWPWEQTYGVIQTGVSYKNVQVNLEGASTLFTYSGLPAQDSDWLFPHNPGQKTDFSEAEAKPRGWTIDANVGFDIPLSNGIKCILGYRAQQFSFTYTDMNQVSISEPESSGFFPGETIQFTQNYKHYYGGGAISSIFDLGTVYPRASGTDLFVRLLGDVGYVIGDNVDFHILRIPAPRYTYENTSGYSWRINLAIDLKINSRFHAGLAGEFMRIRTSGSHRLTQAEGFNEQGQWENALDWTWDGAKVWSDQKFIEINASLYF